LSDKLISVTCTLEGGERLPPNYSTRIKHYRGCRFDVGPSGALMIMKNLDEPLPPRSSMPGQAVTWQPAKLVAVFAPGVWLQCEEREIPE
jgi:hypothetical protein